MNILKYPQIDNGSLQADCSYQPSFDRSHEGPCFAFQDQKKSSPVKPADLVWSLFIYLHGVCIFGKILHLFHSFSVSVSCHIIDDKDLLFELCTQF